MSYEELYEQAKKGDAEALENLVECAEVGEAEAQYLLSCLYETDGPLKNEEQSYYWLDMASYNGNQQAKQKLQERPIRKRTNVYGEDSSFNISHNNEKIKKDESEKNSSYLWMWLLFFLLFIASYVYKCEKNRMTDEEFNSVMKSLKHDDKVFNPSEHIQMDSNLNIKADKEYIEWMEKKANSTHK